MGMASVRQPALGTGTAALETPLCRAVHEETAHPSIYCCWSASSKCNSWERKRRGKAPVSHAGTPPSTGKSALSACEENPAAPLLHTFREARSLYHSQSSWRKKSSWHTVLAALQRLRGQQPSCHTACESPRCVRRAPVTHRGWAGCGHTLSRPVEISLPCTTKGSIHAQVTPFIPGRLRVREASHLCGSSIAVPTLLQPNCLIVPQNLIFHRILSLQQNRA